MLTVRNIVAGKRLYDIWQVNEDAEYHEAGSEGQISADQRAALGGLRDVPCHVPRPA
jgi:hypothetical protein